MKTNSKQTIAEKLAFHHKYDIVKHYGQLNSCDVFVAENNSDSTPIIGYPTFIIVDNKNQARFATSSETLDIMGIHPIEDKNYSGEML